MKRLLALALCLALCLPCEPALADDVCVLDTAAGAQVTTDRSYVRVVCPEVSGAVTVSAWDSDGTLIYQKAYGGELAGAFRSDDVYLPLTGETCVYTVQLAAGERTYTFTVTRRMPRLTGNTACSVGYPLSAVTGRDSWQSVTILDLRECAGKTVAMPLQASGAYTLGTVRFSVSGGQLTVSADISGGIDCTLDDAKVYVAVNALEARELGGKRFPGAVGGLDSPIALDKAAYAVVYVKLTVSFDPAGVPGAPKVTQPGQDELWQIVNETTINEAVG